jgi:hypothetical protein
MLFAVSAAFAAFAVEANPIVETFHLKASNTPIVKRAILKACNDRKWVVKEKEPGELIAVLSSGDRYSLAVLIKYSNEGYSIEYSDSEGMKYNAEKNTIHSSYERWIKTLNKDINTNINSLMAIKESE